MTETEPETEPETETETEPATEPNPRHRYRTPRGPFRAFPVREDDSYELSSGHPIYCMPTGSRGSSAAATGSAVLSSDPAVESSGVETG